MIKIKPQMIKAQVFTAQMKKNQKKNKTLIVP